MKISYRERVSLAKHRLYNSKGKGHVTAKYSFISKTTGKRIGSTSKYMPH